MPDFMKASLTHITCSTFAWTGPLGILATSALACPMCCAKAAGSKVSDICNLDRAF